MSGLVTREDLGLLEKDFLQKSWFSFSLFGYRFCLLAGKSRRARLVAPRVAILVTSNDNAWERRVIKGLVVSMMNAFSPEQAPEFDIFSAEGSQARLRDEVLPLIAERIKEYSCVVTVGPWVSKMTKAFIRESRLKLPQVFVGVQDPAALGLVRSAEIPEPGIIGVMVKRIDYARCLESLFEVTTGIKAVLVPHDESHGDDGAEFDRAQLITALKARNIEVKKVLLKPGVDVVEQLVPHMGEVQAVWSVHEHVVQSAAKRIARECEKYGLVYCADDVASVFQGADIGWGDSGSNSGAYAGNLCALLSIGISLDEVKTLEISTPTAMRVNPGFFDRAFTLYGTRILTQHIIPLGWD